MARLFFYSLAVVAILASARPVHVQPQPARIALLIGNQAYSDQVGPLKNPHNDVALLDAALRQLGFAVTVLKDAGYRDMDTAIKRHIADVRRAGAGALSFFYYSGHGVANPETQINYLIPVDVRDANDPSLWHLSFEQNDIIEKLNRQAPQATHYVVFDACRNELRLTGAGQKALGAEKGFVPVAQTAGLLIAYATAPKQTASDVGDGGGPYARALAGEIVKPGVEAVTMFRNVQLKVKQSIGQDPWLSFPSLPEVYLAGRASAQPAVAPPASTHSAAAIQPTPAARTSDAAEAWSVAEKSTDPTVLEAYIRRFGETFFGDLAKSRLAALADEQKRLALLQSQEESRQRAAAVAALAAAEADAKAWEEAAGRDVAYRIIPGSGRTFRDCTDGCPEMVVVPSGSFMMGAPAGEPERNKGETQLWVTIAKPFAVGRFAITRGEFATFVQESGHIADSCAVRSGTGWELQADKSWRSAGFEQDDRHPVVCVNWHDAKAFLAWLSKKTGKTYRLLSEAEREYVTRAGTTTPFWWGSSITSAQANYNGNRIYSGGLKGQYLQRTVPVYGFLPNPWGLFNVHGNVWEWTEDCWNDYNDGNPGDGRARTRGDCGRRVVRGGSWYYVPGFLRSAYRFGFAPNDRYATFGFRVARTL